MKKYLVLATLAIIPSLSNGASIDKESIRAVVVDNIKYVQTCYETALANNSTLRGKLVVDWIVNDKGDVEKATVNDAKTTLKDPTFLACAVGKLKTWKFPAAPKGQIVNVSYPFLFSN